MHPFHRSLGFLLSVSLGVLCFASSVIGQQKSTAQSSLDKNLLLAEPLQPLANGSVQPKIPAPPSRNSQSIVPEQSGTSDLSIDPFQKINDSEPKLSIDPRTSNPFDPILGEVASTLNAPIPFASLPSGELVKAEEKIRIMRIAVLTNAIEVVYAQMQAMDVGVGHMREYAELWEDLTTLEFQKAKSSDERQASIQRAIDAWRLNEKIASARMQHGSSSIAYFFAAQKRLRWEQALVKELRAATEAKSASQPVIQSSVVHYPTVQQQTVYYPSVAPATVVGQPSPTYYYPSQPTYQYSRSYRSR